MREDDSVGEARQAPRRSRISAAEGGGLAVDAAVGSHRSRRRKAAWG
jgi:hypothetical protein